MTYDLTQLTRLGIEHADAVALQRLSMTLRRWYERERGNGNGCIERDEPHGDTLGRPYWVPSNGHRPWPIPDFEQSATRRLTQVLRNYPTIGYYLQIDPRGYALYILRPGDVPEDEKAESYYLRGVAVYK